MSSAMASAARKTLQRSRHAIAEEREHTEGKGDIGGHRDTPAGRARSAMVEQSIEPCGNDHPAERRRDGQRGFSKRSQLTDSVSLA